jgi:hypothetical protein
VHTRHGLGLLGYAFAVSLFREGSFAVDPTNTGPIRKFLAGAFTYFPDFFCSLAHGAVTLSTAFACFFGSGFETAAGTLRSKAGTTHFSTDFLATDTTSFSGHFHEPFLRFFVLPHAEWGRI